MKLEDFQVGDLLTNEKWGGNIYEVLEINSDTEELFIKNTLESTGFWWEFFVNYDNIHIIRNSNDPNKTPIERKIAHLYKLFEERKKSCPDAA